MASKRLDDLDPTFRPLAVELIARATEARIPLRIIETRRTHAEHLENVKRGVSWTGHSKHEDGLAIDLCPTELLAEKNWNPQSILWDELGAIAQQLGLIWGGSWKQTPDFCHFQMAAKEVGSERQA